MSEETKRPRKEHKLLGKIFYIGSHDFYDYGLVFVLIFLMLFGLIMVYSTTAYSDTTTYNDAFYSLRKQATFAGFALLFMILISKFDYHWILKCSPLMLILSFILCVAVIFIGSESNGSSRWLNIGGVSVQPSELVKPSVVMVLSLYLTMFYDPHSGGIWAEVKYSLRGLIGVFIVTLPVLKENLSTALIIMLIGYFMCYMCTKIRNVYWVALIAAIILVVVLWNTGFLKEHILKEYQAARIEAWLNPEESTENSAYQILQGLYAIGSGGLFGKGLGSSIQKLGYLPEAQNDMIFTIICEELGICGALLVIILYIALIFRLVYIANNAPDMAGGLLVSGIMIHISIQVLFNILVVTNLFPNTGITLPFISYGGSALVVLICEMGLALSVSNQIKVKADERRKA